MNCQNVIPFDGHKKAEVQNPRRGFMPVPLNFTFPILRPVEVEPAPSFRYEEPAQDSDVLFEQLEYLIQFADREPDRFNRVRAILLERFN